MPHFKEGLIFCTLITLSSLRVAAGALFTDSPTVTELTADSYRASIDEIPTDITPDWVVMHYSSMCGHCINFAAEFQELSSAFKFVANLRFGAIDLGKPSNVDIRNAKNIRNVPTVQLIRVSESSPGVLQREVEQLLHTRAYIVPRLETIYATAAIPCSGDMCVRNKDHLLVHDARSFSRDAATALWLTLQLEVCSGDCTVITREALDGLSKILLTCKYSFELERVADACDGMNLELQSTNQSELSKDAWLSILERRRNQFPIVLADPVNSLSSCNTMTCALWRLFHIFSLGKGGEATGIEHLTAMEAIHVTVDKFFSCTECRDHFLLHYNQCDFGRCEAQSWKDVALWLYRLHNQVTLRVHPDRPQWPTDCPNCHTDDNSMFEYLVEQFRVRTDPLSLSGKGFTLPSLVLIICLISV